MTGDSDFDMKKMYQEANLVHSDLSEYNILMIDNEPMIIDVGQAVLTNHPMANEFLERDVRNILAFFTKLCIEKDYEEVLSQVQGGE